MVDAAGSSRPLRQATASRRRRGRRLDALTARLQGGRLVSGIETDAVGNVTALVARDTATGQEERLEADAVVFAISIAGGSACGVQPRCTRRQHSRSVPVGDGQAMPDCAMQFVNGAACCFLEPAAWSAQICLQAAAARHACDRLGRWPAQLCCGCSADPARPPVATQACSGWCRPTRCWPTAESSRT